MEDCIFWENYQKCVGGLAYQQQQYSKSIRKIGSSYIGGSERGLVEDVNSGSSVEAVVTGDISRITSETRMVSNK